MVFVTYVFEIPHHVKLLKMILSPEEKEKEKHYDEF